MSNLPRHPGSRPGHPANYPRGPMGRRPGAMPGVVDNGTPCPLPTPTPGYDEFPRSGTPSWPR